MNIFCSDEKARKTSQILQDFLPNFEKIPNRKHFITFIIETYFLLGWEITATS